jgi:uncharacterized protein (DUF2267 family)
MSGGGKLIFSVISVALALSACSGKEPQQRRAFANLLQARLSAEGSPAVSLSPAEASAIGGYADDYAVISDFQLSLRDDVETRFRDLMNEGRKAADVGPVARRGALAQARDAAVALAQLLRDDLAKAEAGKAALELPADLKPIYDKAFEKNVSDPAAAFLEVLPTVGQTFAADVAIADFIAAHPGQLEVSGTVILVHDPSIQGQLNQLIDELNEKSRQISAVQGKLQAVINGR